MLVNYLTNLVTVVDFPVLNKVVIEPSGSTVNEIGYSITVSSVCGLPHV
jgi:hypothetical protein